MGQTDTVDFFFFLGCFMGFVHCGENKYFYSFISFNSVICFSCSLASLENMYFKEKKLHIIFCYRSFCICVLWWRLFYIPRFRSFVCCLGVTRFSRFSAALGALNAKLFCDCICFFCMGFVVQGNTTMFVYIRQKWKHFQLNVVSHCILHHH